MSNDLKLTTFEIERNSRNVHTLRNFYSADWGQTLLFAPDLHWDNPKSDHALIKKHFDEAKRRNAKIMLFGDTFCLMQGKYDPRGNKSDLRPEHQVHDYFDSIVRTAVDFFGPYADNICLVTQGNHETSVLKRHETDIVTRFVDMMNIVHRPIQPIQSGGYGGWVRFVFDRENSSDKRTVKLKYFHGSGGGGIVTKGMITNQRRQAQTQGADIIVSGHVHEDVMATFSYEHLNEKGVVEIRHTQHIIAGTYKEEFADGDHGWHIERGAPPKPLGGAWLDFFCEGGEIKFNTYRAK